MSDTVDHKLVTDFITALGHDPNKVISVQLNSNELQVTEVDQENVQRLAKRLQVRGIDPYQEILNRLAAKCMRVQHLEGTALTDVLSCIQPEPELKGDLNIERTTVYSYS